MADNREFWENDDSSFDGEIDQSVFGDNGADLINHVDDGFNKDFDAELVDSAIREQGNLFDTAEENFGKDGYTQFYSTEGGRKTEESEIQKQREAEKTRVLEDDIKEAAVSATEEEIEDTRRLDNLQETAEAPEESGKKKKKKKSNEKSRAKPSFGGDADNGEEEMSDKPKKKRRGCLGAILYVLFVICASFLLAAAGWVLSTDVLGLGKEDRTVVVTIPKNYDMNEVTNILHTEGVVKFKPLFKLFASISHAEDKIAAGTYEMNTNYDYRAIVAGMTKSGGKLVEVSVVIPEGYNMMQIFETLEKNAVCFKDDLMEAAKNYDFEYDFLDKSTLGNEKRLEGFLFPDTYKFYMNDTPSRVLDKMLSNFKNKFTEEYKERAESRGYSIRDIVTVASIIEKEAAGDKDRADIASVIFNRLNNTSAGTMGYLQLDSTIHYILYGTGKEFSTEIDSPYNTYKYKGLPAGPISNPGVAAIKAALYPNDTRYYYFALNKNGEHEFFRYYDSFVDFINSDDYAG